MIDQDGKPRTELELITEVIDLWLRLKFGVTLEDVKNETEKLLELAKVTPPNIQVFEITLACVCFSLGVSEGDVRGKSRIRRLVYARHLSMLLCKELTSASLSKIGRFFGQRDHSTVLHGIRQAKNMVDVYEEDRDRYESLKAQISDRIDLPIVNGRYTVTEK